MKAKKLMSSAIVLSIVLSNTSLYSHANTTQKEESNKVKIEDYNPYIDIEKIELNEDTIKMKKGGKYALNTTVAPANAIDKGMAWESENENIATVDEHGVVTATGEGTTNITITSSEDVKSTCKVTVSGVEANPKSTHVAVESVTLSKKEHTVKVGSELDLDFFKSVKPRQATNKNVIWTSSDDSIATVNHKGEVIAHKEGKVTITVTTEDGGFADSATVTVTPVLATGMKVTKEKTMLTVGTTEQLHTEFAPENATNKSVNWSSSNEEAVTVDSNGAITAVGKGEATITGLSQDGGFESTIVVEVVEEIDYTIDSPYKGVNWKTVTQNKADLHTHTNREATSGNIGDDGDDTLQVQIDTHNNLGYDIMATTGHDVYTNPHNETEYPGLNKYGMKYIVGSEYSSIIHHMNGFFLAEKDVPGTFKLASGGEKMALEAIKNSGGLGHINHPGRYYTPGNAKYNIDWYKKALRENEHMVGLEVINREDRYSGDRVLWDNILTDMIDERDVWGFANSDAHRTTDIDTSYNMFLIDGEYTEEKMRQAMENGEFYFTAKKTAENNKQNDPNVAPPVITNVVVDNEEDSLTIEGDGIESIEWVSSNSRTIGEGNTIDLDEATSSTPYVRAVIKNAGGVTFTQPFKVDAKIDESAVLPENIIDPSEVEFIQTDKFTATQGQISKINIQGKEMLTLDDAETTYVYSGEELLFKINGQMKNLLNIDDKAVVLINTENEDKFFIDSSSDDEEALEAGLMKDSSEIAIGEFKAVEKGNTVDVLKGNKKLYKANGSDKNGKLKGLFVIDEKAFVVVDNKKSGIIVLGQEGKKAVQVATIK